LTPSPFPDAWDWLCRAVWTRDEASGEIRQFPAADERYAYLRPLVDAWQAHRILFVDKARRMLVTWLFVALWLYDVTHVPQHADYVISKKLEDAAYLLGAERMQFIWDHVSAQVWPNKPEVQFRNRSGRGWEIVECPATGSIIQAVAQGADQLRQYTASNVFIDEFAFQDRQAETWTALQPTILGGGHIVAVSTANLGAYMWDLMNDQVE